MRDVLDQAERGVLPGMVRTGRTFADAAAEYLRYLAEDRQRKPWAVRDARSLIRNHLLPSFGERALEDITEQEVERWASRLGADRPLSNATKRKVIVITKYSDASRHVKVSNPHRDEVGLAEPLDAS